jgi:hypothetical protein
MQEIGVEVPLAEFYEGLVFDDGEHVEDNRSSE